MITQRRGNLGITWPCFNIDSRIFIEKNSCCVFGGITLMCIWWISTRVAQTEQDHYWGSLPNTIDEIEPSTQGKTRPLLLQA